MCFVEGQEGGGGGGGEFATMFFFFFFFFFFFELQTSEIYKYVVKLLFLLFLFLHLSTICK